jgi:phage terminase large subunit-like protein
MSQNKLTPAEYDQKVKELKEMQEMLKLKEGLPHLFGFPFYEWSRRIFESKRKQIFLTSANQVGKSSCAIKKNIHLATSPNLWKEYWPGLIQGQKPGLFWYLYPTREVATTEVEQKWIKEFLPRGEYKDHPQFGWDIEYNKGEVYAIHFKTGVTIQFKTYAQKAKDLQTSSVYHLTCDEELPVDLLPELSARLNATDGYFLMVFTATLGQLHWKKTMEPSTADEEQHKDALKIQVSLFDSMKYEDGSPSPWTKEKINRAINNCPTEAEVQRRIYGRFVKSEGLMYEGFSLEKNLTDNHPLPQHWSIYSGCDPGSGGKSGHPAALVFVAVDPTYRSARVFRGWRGDGIPTTSQDILDKYRELKGKLQPVAQVYDYAAKDFFMIASRAGEAFQPADKGRDRGVAMLNTLFKSGMLKIQRGDPELDKLVNEICSLSSTTAKTVAVDDFVDALRYTIMAIPWDFADMGMSETDKLKLGMKIEESKPLTNSEQRREWILSSGKKPDESIEDEFSFWSGLLD